MRSIKLLAVSLFALLVLVLPSVSASRPVINSTWTATPPTIDGTFQLGEWSNPQIVFEAPIIAYVYFVNDGSNLYVMVDAVGDDDDDAGDESLMWFNYDGAGYALNVVMIKGTVGTEITTPFHAVVGFGGSPNSVSPPHKIYEFSIPFSWLNKMPGQPIDFCSPMWKFGSSISYDGSGGRDNVWPVGIGAPPIPLDSWGQTDPATGPAVGGVVMPVNMFAVLGPWLAVIGLVGCIATVVVVAKKRRSAGTRC
jgi:hypothetical protein